MTEKEYEGTPELIFYCEYNPNNFEDRLEIPFTNEYDIKLDFSRDTDNQIRINVDLQPKESNVPKGFFGKNILNITAIAGKNGTGKTKLLKHLNLYHKKFKDSSMLCLFKDGNSIYFEVNNELIHIYVNGEQHINSIQNDVVFYSYNIFDEDPYVDIHQHVEEKTLFARYDLKIHNLGLLYYLLTSNQVGLSSQFKEFFKIHPKRSMFIRFRSSGALLSIIQKNIKNDGDNIFYDRLINEVRCNFFFFTVFCCIDEILDRTLTRTNNIQEKLAHYFSLNNICTRKTDRIVDDLLDIVYFENYFNIGSVLKYIEKIPESYFHFNNSDIYIKFNANTYNNDVFLVLYYLDENDYIHIFIDIGDYSAGEESILYQISALYYCINNYIKDLRSYRKKHSFIFCFDEYELNLHPEWSRRYLGFLLEYLNETSKEYTNLFFQLVLTTHSPYLISDLPKENIILLEKDEKTGRRTARKSNYGFASNYYDIMSDNFFLDDTIGEFAKQKINECIRKMNTIMYLLKKIKDKNLVISKLLNKKIPIRIKGIEQIISIVGDPYIKKPLEGMLSALLDQLNSLKPKRKSLDEILRERQIALQSSGTKND